MSGERPSVWNDPSVVAAINEGRPLDEISIMSCRSCWQMSYYNDGSSFTCSHCGAYFRVVTQEEYVHQLAHEDLPSGGVIVLDDHRLSMQDVVDAECEDYP